MLRNILATLAAPLSLDARRALPDETDCWLDTPDDDGEPDDAPLPDDAAPEQEDEIAARYDARRRAARIA